MSDKFKQAAAEAVLDLLQHEGIIGVGSGSTVAYFIEALKRIRGRVEGTVASSVETAQRLKAAGFPVFDLNTVGPLAYYVDGADEINTYGQMIKGGGGALTREKIIATVAQQFICIADERKWVSRLGQFPVALEVLPIARSYVGREMVKLGAQPVYREGFVTDNNQIILDVYNLNCDQPRAMEAQLNQITGVVENGLFGQRTADYLCLAGPKGVDIKIFKVGT